MDQKEPTKKNHARLKTVEPLFRGPERTNKKKYALRTTEPRFHG